MLIYHSDRHYKYPALLRAYEAALSPVQFTCALWGKMLNVVSPVIHTTQVKCLMSKDAEPTPFCQHLPGKHLRPSAEMHCRCVQVPALCTNKWHQQGPQVGGLRESAPPRCCHSQKLQWEPRALWVSQFCGWPSYQYESHGTQHFGINLLFCF